MIEHAAAAASTTPEPTPAAPIRARSGPLADFERLFGADFSNVQITEDPAVAGHGALAITEGDRIRFAPGQHRPGSAAGRELLAHELAHVIQQRQGRAPTAGATGALAIDVGLEAEADAAAARVAHGQPALLGAAPDTARTIAAQPKLGFEIELQVALTQGAFDPGDGDAPYKIQGASNAEVPYLTVDQLKATPAKFRNQLRWDTLVAVQSNQSGAETKLVYLRWDPGASKGFRPDDIKPEKPGRWIKDDALTETVSAPQRSYVDPNLHKEANVYQGAGYKVVEDHAQLPFYDKVASVIEFVTDALDESLGEAAFLAPMRAVIAKATQIEQATNNLAKRIPAHTVFPGARRDLYLGCDGAFSQSMSGHMQSTFGLQLDGVPGLLESKKSGLAADLNISERALSSAEHFIKEANIDRNAMPRLAGLIHLVCTYLVAGSTVYQGRGGLDKNQVPFLLRHSVSLGRPSSLTVPEKQWLVHNKPPEPVPVEDVLDFSSPYTRRVEDREQPKVEQVDLLERLLAACGRSSSEKLFVQMQDSINVASWLRAALWGNDDHMIEWGLAQTIPPERCGPAETTGVVLEERHPCSTMISLSAWEGFAAAQYQRTRKLNGLG